jgi:glyoxylase I family protein
MTCRRKTETIWLICTLGLIALAAGCNGALSNEEGRDKGVAAKHARVRLEHVALNVADPVRMAQWYVDNLDMRIMRKGPPPVNMRFIADSGGNMMLELYHNPPDAVPDYAAMNPLLLHVAFMVDDVEAIRAMLIAAGATPTDGIAVTEAGDKLTILRDPWGLAIQLLKRADPMLRHD